MVDWLAAVAIFWVGAAIHLGGMYDVEHGASAGKQTIGLVVLLGLYLATFYLIRLVTVPMDIGIFGDILIPSAIPAMLLGRGAMLVFKLLGMRLHRAVFSAEGH